MLKEAIHEAKRKAQSTEELSTSVPAGDMVITTYNYWAPYGKQGYVVVEITKELQNGKLVDWKKFTFKSQGDNAFNNGSNSAYRKASKLAHEYSRGEGNLWRNMKDYDNLSDKEKDEIRATGNMFWDDDNIRTRRKR